QNKKTSNVKKPNLVARNCLIFASFKKRNILSRKDEYKDKVINIALFYRAARVSANQLGSLNRNLKFSKAN
ncbi:hypothetical protein L0M92_16320, partial [Casaltella massiliensis]|nr:hypothetical protein [Casaltella massiliensis]